jgi:hypothetical protein
MFSGCLWHNAIGSLKMKSIPSPKAKRTSRLEFPFSVYPAKQFGCQSKSGYKAMPAQTPLNIRGVFYALANRAA